MQGSRTGRAGRSPGSRVARVVLDAVIVALTGFVGVAAVSGMAQAGPTAAGGPGQRAQTTLTVPSEVQGAEQAGAAGGPSNTGSTLRPTTLSSVPAPAPASVGTAVQQQISATVGPAQAPVTGPVGSIQQTITVAVRPGGPIRITPDRVTVSLHWSGRQLVGTLGPIQLTDPRGTLAGWRLVARLVGDDRAPVLVIPGHPVALGGRPSEVTQGTPQATRGDGSVLMSAAPGGGGGTFEVSAQVEVPYGRHAPDGPLTFVLSVASRSNDR